MKIKKIVDIVASPLLLTPEVVVVVVDGVVVAVVEFGGVSVGSFAGVLPCVSSSRTLANADTIRPMKMIATNLDMSLMRKSE